MKQENDTIVRALTFPVNAVEGCTWEEFRELLEARWREATVLANHVMTGWRVADSPGVAEGKVPPFPGDRNLMGRELYRAAREAAPAMHSQSVATVCRAAMQKYFAARFDLLRGKVSLPSFRFPFPYPVPAQAYTARLSGDGRMPVVDLPVTSRGPDGSARRVTLVLAGGRGFERFMPRFRALADGTAKACEMSVYRQRADGSHRRVVWDRNPLTGENVPYRVMCKIAVRVDRPPARQLDGTLLVRTVPHSFLAARVSGRPGNERWGHEDQVRRWEPEMRATVAAWRRRLARLADDRKAERRAGSEPDNLGHLDRAKAKHDRRVKSFLEERSAHVANLSVRLGVAEVVYDDTDRSWVASFPWSAFWDRLACKLDEHGVRLVPAAARRAEMAKATKAADLAAAVAAMAEEFESIRKESERDGDD